MTNQSNLISLAHMIEQSNHVVVLTGAGISMASGISTFRGNDDNAIWKDDEKKKAFFEYQENPTEIGTRYYFNQYPTKSWYWYYTRFASVFDKKPNPAHTALVDLKDYCIQQDKSFDLITQNIDGLHRKAGLEDYVEIHGQASRIRCSNVGCTYAAPYGSLPLNIDDFAQFVTQPIVENIPTCPSCQSLLRPHVLWFDERYSEHVDYQFEDAYQILEQGDLLIFIGTSLSVGVTAQAMYLFEEKGAPIWLIDPHPVDEDVHTIIGKSEEQLPLLIEYLTQAKSK